MIKDATILFIPVRSSRAAAPPSRSMEVTITLVARAKMIMMMCVTVPNLTLMTSKYVCMCEQRRFTATAMTEKRRIGIEAPEAYQKGPLNPTDHPMFDDMSN